MAYNMKKSPINKGTAAKPSPMREFFSAAALTTAAITAAIGAGTTAISKSKANKKAKKDALIAEKKQKNTNVKESMSNTMGSEGSKIISVD